MSGSHGVDNQFAGQLQFSQAAFLAGRYDFVKIFPCLGWSNFSRLFYQGDGSGRAGRHANTTSDTAIERHHGRLLFFRNADCIDQAAFHAGTASFACFPVYGGIKVRGPEVQRFGEVPVHPQHPAAASAT